MENGAGVGGDVAVGVNVRHDVMSEPLLVGAGGVEVDILGVVLELGDLFGRDVQTQRAFGLGQRDPETPPGAELAPGGPESEHLGAGVAGGERVFVDVEAVHR